MVESLKVVICEEYVCIDKIVFFSYFNLCYMKDWNSGCFFLLRVYVLYLSYFGVIFLAASFSPISSESSDF